MTTPIPGPKGYPWIGNVLDIQDEVPIRGLERLIDVHGPIYKLKLGRPEQTIFVGNFELFDQLCDETRFFKIPPPALTAGRPPGETRGLFSAHSEKDEAWRLAHRVLMPAFGPMAIEGMFDEMHDIATQMVMKWARKGSENKILLTADFTRLTLDTIALCAMDYRFNSFYSDDVHPFVQAMNVTLAARSQSGQIGTMIKKLLPSYTAEIQRNQQYMQSVGKELVQHRRDHPTEKHDLLNAMIHGKDPKTGEQMWDELISANMQTFLIAGHETTSGLLSFAFMNMLLNPSTFFAAQQEVDEVVGKEKIQVKHLNQLKYIDAVLKETLRLTPTAPAFARGVRPENKEECVTIGKENYEIPRGVLAICLIGKIQKDPEVWGDDADEFKPERMLPENLEKIPKNAWKPFGTGMRACIGRAFAWQEALLVTAMLLQNFDTSLDDPNYQINIQQALTIKPKDCYIHAKLRPGISATGLQERLSGTAAPSTSEEEIGKVHDGAHHEDDGAPMTILFGSNTGTCQALAQKLAAEASEQGYKAVVKDMDQAIDGVPKTGEPCIVITASYEGQPPDNAARFGAWLETIKGENVLNGAHFAVFGCGHKDWASTYQRIPTLVDDLLAQHGGSRITTRGSADASQRDMFGDFDKWLSESLWPALASQEKRSKPKSVKTKMPSVDLDISTQGRASHLQQKVQWSNVVNVKTLTVSGQPEKRHIEFQLPSDMLYRAGDYLAVLPLNPDESIRRVVKRFKLPWDCVITITKGGSTTLPTNAPISIYELLRGYVEIAQAATRKDIELLLDTVTDGCEKEKLKSLTQEKEFTTRILEQRTSILDILEDTPSSTISFASFLALLPPLRPRHYSISSSPLADPTICSLTYSVLDLPTWSDSTKRFLGVTGTYLQRLQPGDQALVSVRSTNKFFRLPPNPEKTPLLMFCAGSGLAPFRGFLQERAVLIKEGGRKLAPALLFVGCRSATADRLYAEEMDAWVCDGVVDVRYAFSKEPKHELAQGCARVQERMVKDKGDVFQLFIDGAKVYTCGSAELLRDLGDAARKMILERKREKEGEHVTAEEVDAWIKDRKNDRFVSDVFS